MDGQGKGQSWIDRAVLYPIVAFSGWMDCMFPRPTKEALYSMADMRNNTTRHARNQPRSLFYYVLVYGGVAICLPARFLLNVFTAESKQVFL